LSNHPKDSLIAEREQMMSELRLLVEALDRRVPHLDRLGELQIVEDAADLRRRAVGLIAKMKGLESDPS
jgi:hypothetical protein